MPRPAEEREREDRIHEVILVDAYHASEKASSWYYYLADRLACPFDAQCVVPRATSPLRSGERVEVVGMADEDECEHEMFVTVRWRDLVLAVPLAQLQPIEVDDEGAQAVGDWQYWMARGYEF